MLLAVLMELFAMQLVVTIQVEQKIPLKTLAELSLMSPFASVGIVAVARQFEAAPKRMTLESQISSLRSTQTSSHLLKNLF